jgi:hypothetical protein
VICDAQGPCPIVVGHDEAWRGIWCGRAGECRRADGKQGQAALSTCLDCSGALPGNTLKHTKRGGPASSAAACFAAGTFFHEAAEDDQAPSSPEEERCIRHAASGKLLLRKLFVRRGNSDMMRGSLAGGGSRSTA